MIRRKAILVAALMAMVSVTAARAECQIADAKLEEAIQQNPPIPRSCQQPVCA